MLQLVHLYFAKTRYFAYVTNMDLMYLYNDNQQLHVQSQLLCCFSSITSRFVDKGQTDLL